MKKNSLAAMVSCLTFSLLAFSCDFGPRKCAEPVFDPPEGTYTQPIEVSMTSATGLIHISYTTDGSDPTLIGFIPNQGGNYVGPVLLGEGTTILKAYAFGGDLIPSEVVVGTYIITRVYSADWACVSYRRK